METKEEKQHVFDTDFASLYPEVMKLIANETVFDENGFEIEVPREYSIGEFTLL